MNEVIPVLILAFNRPDFLEKRLQEITTQSVKPDRIIVSVDGPRTLNDQDVESICMIMNILESYKTLGVSVIKRERNLGCTNNTIASVGEVLAKYEKIIVLDDDVSIAPVFYEQMVLAINHFLNHEINPKYKILTIGGFSPFFNNRTNFFTRYALPKNKWRATRYFHSWGWATSRDFWFNLKRLNNESINFDEIFSNSRHWGQLSERKKTIWKRRFRRSWDYEIQGNLFLQDGLNIFPYYRIIQNEGLGDQRSTHTKFKKPWHIFGRTFSRNTSVLLRLKKSNLFWKLFESNSLAADGWFIARGRNKGIRTLAKELFLRDGKK